MELESVKGCLPEEIHVMGCIPFSFQIGLTLDITPKCKWQPHFKKIPNLKYLNWWDPISRKQPNFLGLEQDARGVKKFLKKWCSKLSLSMLFSFEQPWYTLLG